MTENEQNDPISRDRNIHGDEVHEDKVAGDKVAGDKIAGDKFEIGDISDSEGIAIGRYAQAIVKNVQNVYHNMPRNTQIAITAIAVFMGVVMLILAWQSSFGEYVSGLLAPLEKGTTFNVAILDFGEIESDGEFTQSDFGNEASKWLYERLDRSIREFQGEIFHDTSEKKIGIFHRTSVGIRKRHMFRPLLISDPDEQCKRASELANDIGVHMVIFGNLDKQHDSAEFELLFDVTDDIQNWMELNDIETGSTPSKSRCLPLGHAFSVGKSLSGPIVHDAIKDEVESRGPIFFGLLLALIQDSQGDWSNALDYLSQVESHLEELELHPREAGDFGADLVAMLIGQQYLRQFNEQTDNSKDVELEKLDLSLLDKAVENFQNALSYEGRHRHRAEKAMGDIWSLMGRFAQNIYARNGPIDDEILDVPLTYTNASEIMERLVKHHQNIAHGLSHASSYYQNASEHAKDSDDPHVALAIDLALAETLWQEGQLFYIIDKQDEALDKMNAYIDITTKGENSLLNRAEVQQSHRLIAGAYKLIGLTYYQLFQILQQSDEQLASLENAEEYFERCISKAEDAPLDQLIKYEIVEDFCQPYLKEVQKALENTQN